MESEDKASVWILVVASSPLWLLVLFAGIGMVIETVSGCS